MSNNNSIHATRLAIDEESIRDEIVSLSKSSGTLNHAEVFEEILENLDPIDFHEVANLAEDAKVTQKIQVVVTVQEVLRVAQALKCGLCRHLDFMYAFNGEFWQLINRDELSAFLGEAAERLGVDPITAKYHRFRTELYKQFLAHAYLSAPNQTSDVVLINLKNGTYEIDRDRGRLRKFRRDDFLTYQLPFEYQETATCSKWQKFLDEVLPDRSAQAVLAEYFGYVFAIHLKLEKTLLLFGIGENGKSVVFDVMTALFGPENISHYSLQSLCDNYFRAMIANRLLNYSSEISNRLQAEKFKQLTSGEPIEARLPYGQPMMLHKYARLAFNCNELPRDVEHTNAFFRRWLILSFNVIIPKEKRNVDLAKEIIASELSGVFNWVLDGLHRLLDQKGFTECDAADKMLEKYRRESDAVAMFLEDEGYCPSDTETMTVKEIFSEYKRYCTENNYRPLGRNNFAKRLEINGITRYDSYQPLFYLEKV